MSNKEYAIEVENLNKIYRLGVQDQQQEDSLLKNTLGFLKNPIDNYKKYRSLYKFDDIDFNDPSSIEAQGDSVLWALRNVSFKVEKGDVVGIVGVNGAGKSTLLKVLSQITAPTTGKVTLRGRVSSLLEVGTGFHPELTGRENIYLNGTILGMRKAEVEAKFEEIVEFSGVERFLDTPVKRYSSGMRVRLAFAVAAHLEPEILIVDEVLAVGDAAFQKKCLAKMQDVSNDGRTVLFVSHNMEAVVRLCNTAILLNAGQVMEIDTAETVVAHYINAGLESAGEKIWTEKHPGAEHTRLHACRVLGEDGEIKQAINVRDPVVMEMEFDVLKDEYRLLPHFHLFDEGGSHAFVSIARGDLWKKPVKPGRYKARATIPGNLLAEGTMFVTPTMSTFDPHMPEYYERDAVAFQVYDEGEGDTARGDYARKLPGVMRPLLEWETEYVAAL